MVDVKFQTRYRILENGDMVIYMIQTEPVVREIKITDISGIKILRGSKKPLPLTNNELIRIPANMVVSFLGCIMQITNDFGKRMDKYQKLKDEEKI